MQFTLDRGKRPDEKFTLEIDFTDDMETGDTVATETVTAFDEADPATDLSATLVENVVQASGIVGARMKAGADGHTYVLRFEATTTGGDVFEHDVIVPVSITA